MAEEEKCQNSRKQSKDDEEEEEDYISLLPDCLLIEIISRLNFTKEAIRTGTLSKRWQHLWPYVHKLTFEIFMSSCEEWNHQRLSDFLSSVDKTLTQCRQFNLNEFNLFVRYDTQFESQMNNWVRFAFSRNVQDLHLSIPNRYMECEYVLEQYFFVNSGLKYLGLDGCVINPIGAISWSNLNSLFISKGKLDEDLISNILSGCPVLETLGFNECYGYDRIDITSKSVKSFVFSGYDSQEAEDLDDIIEINAPYIVELRIGGYVLLWKLLLLNVSSLVKANLNYVRMGYDETTPKQGKEEMLIAFIESLRHVEELKIGIHCLNTLSRLEAKGFILPLNLKAVVCDSLYPSDSDSDRDLNECGDSDGDSEELLLDDGLESEGGEAD